jgi:hypothetical protein
MIVEEVVINKRPYILKHCFPGSKDRAQKVG